MNNINTPDKVTILTLVSAITGFLAFYLNPLFASAYLVIFAFPIIFPISA